MREVHIECPITIYVAPPGAAAPSPVDHSTRGRDILKRAVTAVVPHRRRSVARDQHVRKTIVVKITDGHAVRVLLRRRHSRRNALFDEPPFVNLSEQRGRKSHDRRPRFKLATTRQKQIRPTITVVVQYPNAAAERFEDRVVLGFFAVVVCECEP